VTTADGDSSRCCGFVSRFGYPGVSLFNKNPLFPGFGASVKSAASRLFTKKTASFRSFFLFLVRTRKSIEA